MNLEDFKREINDLNNVLSIADLYELADFCYELAEGLEEKKGKG